MGEQAANSKSWVFRFWLTTKADQTSLKDFRFALNVSVRFQVWNINKRTDERMCYLFLYLTAMVSLSKRAFNKKIKPVTFSDFDAHNCEFFYHALFWETFSLEVFWDFLSMR